VKCRCGHGRQTHRKASGKKRLPCQTFVTVTRPPFYIIFNGKRGLVTPGPSPEICKCRDWHPVEVTP
jgi:hypothetical protein